MATKNQVGSSLSGSQGTGSFVGSTSASFVTPTIGVATATSLALGGGTALSNFVTASWTPTFTFSTVGNLSVVYTTQNGSYTRVGDIVFVEFTLVCTPTFTTATGGARITGFPINSAKSNCAGEVGIQGANVLYGAGFTGINLTTTNGQSFLSLLAFGSGKVSTVIGAGSFVSGVAITFGGSIAFNV